MQKQTYVVIVKITYKDCPISARPIGRFAPNDAIGLFISDRRAGHISENVNSKISLSVGLGSYVKKGHEILMLRYMDEITPILQAKFGAGIEVELQPANRPQVMF